MKQYKLVIFDVDGTLLDTSEGIISAVIYTIRHYGLDMLSQQQLQSFIGPPIQDSFQRYYPVGIDRAQELATTFRNRYKSIDLLRAVPYEQIYEVFAYLKHHKIATAVATYKRQDYAEELLDHFGFYRYTSIIYGADHFNKLKKRDIIEQCIAKSGISNRSQILMIGDSANDAIGAEQIGIDFLGVTYGFGFKTLKKVYAYPAVSAVSSPLEIIRFFEEGRIHENKGC